MAKKKKKMHRFKFIERNTMSNSPHEVALARFTKVDPNQKIKTLELNNECFIELGENGTIVVSDDEEAIYFSPADMKKMCEWYLGIK